MKRLLVEIYTYGTENRARVGNYRYSEHQDTELLLLGYEVDEEPIQIVDIAHGEGIPHQIIKALSDSQVVKIAYDASFVRVCLSRFLHLPPHVYFPAEQWRCLKSWMSYLSRVRSTDNN